MALLTSTKAAKIIGVHRTTLCRYVADDVLPDELYLTLPGGAKRFDEAGLRNWAKNNLQRERAIKRMIRRSRRSA